MGQQANQQHHVNEQQTNKQTNKQTNNQTHKQTNKQNRELKTTTYKCAQHAKEIIELNRTSETIK